MRQARLGSIPTRSFASAKRAGGWLAMSGGVVWEGFSVSDNLAYIGGLISHFQFMEALGLLHLPPLVTIGFGVVWVVLAQKRRGGAEIVRFVPVSPAPRLPEINDDGEYDYKLEHERRDGRVYERTTLVVTRRR